MTTVSLLFLLISFHLLLVPSEPLYSTVILPLQKRKTLLGGGGVGILYIVLVTPIVSFRTPA
jgi:hypothetical protein